MYEWLQAIAPSPLPWRKDDSQRALSERPPCAVSCFWGTEPSALGWAFHTLGTAAPLCIVMGLQPARALDDPLCAMAAPIHFSPLLPLQVDQRVFRDLMSEKLPRLHAHFEQYKVDYTLITFNWFLVVFVDSVVSDILFKIWDSFLYEGPKVGLLTG